MGRRRGFTLVELLVVIAIISILMALLLPAIQSARESGRRTACSNNLRQVGIALTLYHDAEQTLPIGCIERRPVGNTTNRQLSWIITVLPQLGQLPVFHALNTALPFDAAANRTATTQVIPVLLCPSTGRFSSTRNGSHTNDGLGAADYGGMFGTVGPGISANNGMMLYDQAMKLSDASDGPSQTILVAEDAGRGTAQDGQWANGQNIFDATVTINTQQDNEIWSDHPGGAQILLCDGSVRMLSQLTTITVLRALCTRANGDYVPPDFFD